ncbi:VOC family protein [Devosia sp.]|uniref:VOC family protein n=1 Tax=Devosia sp. TaxID=1871048 RepID=UPI003A9329C1
MTSTAYRIDHIALLVRDLDETAAFLTDVLGIAEIANPMGGTEIRWFEIGNGQRLHVQAGDISATHVEKRTHFALTAPDFDAMLARFRAEGVDFSDMKGTPGGVNVRPDGMRAIFVEDPNGYWFEINDFAPPV